MAEGFREWGNYFAEEEWKRRSPLRKFFSFRTLKKILKFVCIVLVVGVYVVLGYRLITGFGVSKNAMKLIWTDKAYEAYGKYGKNLVVYEQEPDANYGEDGCFSIHNMLYIPETNEVQCIIRFNKSTIDRLKESLTADLETTKEKDAVLASVDDFPFAFNLRDQDDNIYSDYYITSYSEGLYVYVRLSFNNVDFFKTETALPQNNFPAPDEKYSGIIYKGSNKNNVISTDISYLYIDFYYENDVKYDEMPWADPLLVYHSDKDLEKHSFSKNIPTAPEQLTFVSITETK